ncbi:MAG: NERD domain-containing protein [Aphanothece sp. CMT-3BRIN-NPC111]|jgi:hypothetical protein|nr:NERD domain-containing protein [Aphanothece sp. CMT-3BRIN-NPC111]
MSSAGANPRYLALERRIKAVSSFGLAALFGLLPFLISSLSPVKLGIPVYILFILLAGIFVFTGLHLWQWAGLADQGAKAEEIIGLLLEQLEQEGWHIEYGMRLQRLGDVDVFLRSPKHNAYIIDVKSHRGEVVFDGHKLKRRFGRQEKPFEKDFLKLTMDQAYAVKTKKNLRFVTPILAFTDATLNLKQKDNKLRGVYVVERGFLVQRLRQLDTHQRRK